MALNLRQQRFVAEYLKDPNATQAAIKAGYSRKTAGAIGAENLTKPEIRAALTAAQTEVAEDAKLTVGAHLKTLAELRDKAVKAKQHAAAVTAEVNRGKVCGLYVEKVDLTSGGKPLTASERDARIEAIFSMLAKRRKG